MKARRIFALALLFFAIVGLIACGTGDQNLPITSITVSPASADAQSFAVAPGNSQKFLALGNVAPGNSVAQVQLSTVTWSVSDPENVKISNEAGPNFGVATCVNATPNPVNVTAMMMSRGMMISGSATIDCR